MFERLSLTWLDDDFKAYFRVDRRVFEIICKMLAPYITKKNTRWRPALAVELKVGMSLFWLS
jgi:hypothetical protein